MNPLPIQKPAKHDAETVSGMIVSLLFWLSLLVAVALFGAVSLSPRILQQSRLSHEFETNQVQLIQIEQQNEQLQKVLQAIKQDKEFAAEMTRIEFDAVRKDEEVISVDSRLRLSPAAMVAPPTPIHPRVWYEPFLIPLSEDDEIRRNLLLTSATLIIVSFTWLQPGSARRLARPVGACHSVWSAIRSRYIQPVD